MTRCEELAREGDRYEKTLVLQYVAVSLKYVYRVESIEFDTEPPSTEPRDPSTLYTPSGMESSESRLG